MIKNFFIHPQSKIDANQAALKVNGVPANYIFEWTCLTYKAPYQLTVSATASSKNEAEKLAKQQIYQMGVDSSDTITLNLIKVSNIVTQGTRPIL